MRNAQPEFLEGVFLWRRSGYQLAGDPGIDLLNDKYLHDLNPWIRIAAILERAKAGNFDVLSLLIREIQDSNSLAFTDACRLLLGQAGPSSCIRKFLETFTHEIYVLRDWTIQETVALVLNESLLLWTIPAMLNVFLKATKRDDAIIIPHLFSELMEREHGPIYEVESSGIEFKKLVLLQYQELVVRMQSDQLPVLRGNLFSVAETAKRLYDCLTASGGRPEVRRERAVFEAVTGIDCRRFYENGNLQPLAAAAIVEDFLSSQYLTSFEPGVRYFFGHPIPD